MGNRCEIYGPQELEVHLLLEGIEYEAIEMDRAYQGL
jgi:hypothetical protein